MEEYIQLESDGNVFTDIIEKLGVKDVQVTELDVIEESFLQEYERIYGAILLFPYSEKHVKRTQELFQLEPSAIPELLFVTQERENSCGMMAILHILLNLDPEVPAGERISGWRDFFKDITVKDRADAIASMNDLLEINNSYDLPPPFILERQDETKKVSNHYCAFVPHRKVLYQLDGMLQGPVVLESFDTEEKYRQVLVSTLNEQIQNVVADDPSTLNVAVLLVHESELAKQRRHFELEQQLVNDLKKQLETTHNPVVEAEIVMHETKIEEIMSCIEQEMKKEEDRKSEIELMGLNTFPLMDGMMKAFIFDQMQKGTYKEISYPNDNSVLLNALMNMAMEEE